MAPATLDWSAIRERLRERPTPAPITDPDELARLIVDSDLTRETTARAVCRAAELAHPGRPTPEHAARAASECRARLRPVAAAHGWLRCAHCGEWIDVSEEQSADLDTCAHAGEVGDVETMAALMVFGLSGGRLLASFSVPIPRQRAG